MNLKNQFLLDNKVTFLNHGSFGACPKKIFNEYKNYLAIGLDLDKKLKSKKMKAGGMIQRNNYNYTPTIKIIFNDI